MKGAGGTDDTDAAARATEAVTLDLGPLPTQIGFVLRLGQLAVFQDFIRTFAAVDVRPAQHSVLTMIQHNPGIRQADVAMALSIKRTNVVPLLDGLEKRKLIKRKRAVTDRRSYSLYLTDKGQDLMKILDQLRDEHERRVVEFIGTEARDKLLEILPRLQKLSGDAINDDATDD